MFAKSVFSLHYIIIPQTTYDTFRLSCSLLFVNSTCFVMCGPEAHTSQKGHSCLMRHTKVLCRHITVKFVSV